MPTQAVFYVAPNGNDQNPGSLEAPFATLERARDTIRCIKKQGLSIAGVTVFIRGGDYYRTSTFELSGAQDSGTPEAPIRYCAYADEQVRILGGRNVDVESFQLVTDPAVLDRLPAEGIGKVLQTDLKILGFTDLGNVAEYGFKLPEIPVSPELFMNEEKMTLARWPNSVFAKTGPVPDTGPGLENGDTVDGGSAFSYQGDRPNRWLKADDLCVFGYWRWDWAESGLKVKSINTATKEIAMESRHCFGVGEDRPYYVYNLLEELDSPGEWYLDRQSAKLYFYPPVPIMNSKVQLSLLSTPLMTLTDVADITLLGLQFELSRGNGITITRGQRIRVEACTLVRIGQSAVEGNDCFRCGVVGCDVYDIGGAGIVLNGGDRQTLTPGRNYAENNHVYRFGQVNRTYHPAIHLLGVGNRASNNLLHDAPHVAIDFRGNDHVVEYNEVYDVCKETQDAGALYTGLTWTNRGNLIRYNYFHDIHGIPGRDGAQGVYLDDCFSSAEVIGNVFYNVHRAMLIGGGRDNIIRNNLIVNCQRSITLDDRGTWDWMQKHVAPGGTLWQEMATVPCQGSVWTTRYPELAGIRANEPALPKDNVIENNVLVSSGTLEVADLSRLLGRVEQNWDVAENNDFRDPVTREFSLRLDAQVFSELPGFVDIPMDRIGLRRPLNVCLTNTVSIGIDLTLTW